MLSIIICSISTERLHDIEKNIDRTIGCEYEIIAIDNREKRWPIAKVYNHAAAQAKYPYLLFVHEDVEFLSEAWGPFVEEKLREPDCGVIGFAGNKAKLRCYSGWGQYYKWDCTYLYQGGYEGHKTKIEINNAFLDIPFAEVIVLDGIALFVRKEVWKAYPFDEVLLTGFHCYDLDFSIQSAIAGYKNYVCCSNRLLIKHFSLGNYSAEWYRTTIRLYEKWKSKLPVSTPDVNVNTKVIHKLEERTSNDFLKKVQKLKLPESRAVLRKFLQQYPMTWRHFRHCVEAIFRQLTIRTSEK